MESGFPIQVCGRIVRLLGVRVSGDGWLYSHVDLSEAKGIKDLPASLYVDFANLPHDVFEENRPDANKLQEAEDTYRQFLERWGLFREIDLLKGPVPITAPKPLKVRPANHQFGTGVPAELRGPALEARQLGRGFFAVHPRNFWCELCQFKALLWSWVGLRKSSYRDLQQAVRFQEWGQKGPEANLAGIENLSRDELKTRAITTLKQLTKEFTPTLRFDDKVLTVVLTFSSLLPALKGQLLLTILQNHPLMTCQRCGRAHLPKKNTQIFCNKNCAHAAAQKQYEARKKKSRR